ncbi:hypothetical protein Cni_G04218 [Canna indica]|uniref:Uncharacterized protein n=1 Tax=Canna indica TaxID=4628 RepID=A0AAQ3JT01_9LILI|nr:hypothetical protein Cni_G04218 [Canna indica]
MAELAAEVYAASAAGQENRTVQVWRTVLGWLGLLFRGLLQILRAGTPSWAQLLSLVGVRHRLLLASRLSPPLHRCSAVATAGPFG